ncbi:MAG TPA: SDR family oxidoreductase [Terriglobales bacterium]|nr:SDR family oxidoreductase [Terriglobales bacterium]
MREEVGGRVVVITGASSGIGRATALRFARAGDSVVVSARRKNLLKDLVEECEALGTEALAVESDVSDHNSVEKLAKAAIKRFGRIDVWINNAGVGAVGKFDEIPIEEHQRLIETNVNGTLNGSQVALHRFKEQGSGVLINISSVLGKITQPYMSSYSASKHAIRALSGCIRQELWLDDYEDIHVCTVFPQSVDTPFFEHEANYSGFEVKPAPPIETPEKAAEIIFNLAENPQDEAHVGKMGKWMGIQQKLSRPVTEKEMALMTDRKHFDKSKKVDAHSGTLWNPSKSEKGEIHGGWKNGSKMKKPLSAAAMAVPALVGLYVVLKNRKSSQLERVA